MKKSTLIAALIFLAITAIALLTSTLLQSCSTSYTPPANKEVVKPDTLLHYTNVNRNLHTSYKEIDDVLNFEYEGHKYIQFNVYYNRGFGLSVLHDPNCPCLQSKDTL